MFSNKVTFCRLIMPTSNTFIFILSLIKQIEKTQPYNEDKKEQLINVFEEHSIYVVSALSLNC